MPQHLLAVDEESVHRFHQKLEERQDFAIETIGFLFTAGRRGRHLVEYLDQDVETLTTRNISNRAGTNGICDLYPAMTIEDVYPALGFLNELLNGECGRLQFDDLHVGMGSIEHGYATTR